MKFDNIIISGLMLSLDFVDAGITKGRLRGARLTECTPKRQSLDVVLHFDESGSMSQEQQTAQTKTVELFNALNSHVEGDPRVALVGFGYSNSIRVVSDFVDNENALEDALSSLKTSGGLEEGFLALLLTANNDHATSLSFAKDPPVFCSIIFSDEDSDGSTTSSEVLAAYGTNPIIPIVTSAGEAHYEQLCGTDKSFDLNEFNADPQSVIDAVIEQCVSDLPPECVAEEVTVPQDAPDCTAEVFPEDIVPEGLYDEDCLDYVLDPAGPFSVGVHTIQLTVTDESTGLFSMCDTTITVTNVPPVANCNSPYISVDENCQYAPDGTELLALLDNGSFDPDGTIVDRQLDISPPFDLGDSPVQYTLTVTDNCGDTAQCEGNIFLQDTTAPVAECIPGPNRVDHVPPARNEDGFWIISSSDNCGVNSFKVFDLGSEKYFPGPFDPEGTYIKYMQTRNRRAPMQTVGPAGGTLVEYILRGNGDMQVEAKDPSGNIHSVICLVAPPPKRHE